MDIGGSPCLLSESWKYPTFFPGLNQWAMGIVPNFPKQSFENNILYVAIIERSFIQSLKSVQIIRRPYWLNWIVFGDCHCEIYSVIYWWYNIPMSETLVVRFSCAMLAQNIIKFQRHLTTLSLRPYVHMLQLHFSFSSLHSLNLFLLYLSMCPIELLLSPFATEFEQWNTNTITMRVAADVLQIQSQTTSKMIIKVGNKCTSYSAEQ